MDMGQVEANENYIPINPDWTDIEVSFEDYMNGEYQILC